MLLERAEIFFSTFLTTVLDVSRHLQQIKKNLFPGLVHFSKFFLTIANCHSLSLFSASNSGLDPFWTLFMDSLFIFEFGEQKKNSEKSCLSAQK